MPSAGTNFYRVKQRDRDGRFSYSKTVTLDFEKEPMSLDVYPNPVKGGVLQLWLKSEAAVQVYNNAGHLVLQQKCTAGHHTLNVSHLLPGIYTVSTGAASARFVIQ